MLISWRMAVFVIVIGLGVILRCTGLRQAGVIYLDDLRAYSGIAVKETLLSQSPLGAKLRCAYETSISETGARPSLAWIMAVAAALGANSIGSLYLPIAILGAATLFAVALFAARYGDFWAGVFAAAWLAVSSAHIAYSRSALPVVPGSLAFIVGLLLCTDGKQGLVVFSKARWMWAGFAWAIMVSFHPAYVVYLSVPLTLLLLEISKGGGARRKSHC